MNLFITLDGPLGDDLGPYFTLTPTPSGSIDPSIVTKDQLLDGVYVNVGNPLTSSVTITSTGKCKNFVTINVTPTTTTTTTADPCAEPICGQTYEGFGYLYNWFAIFGAGAQTNGGRNVGGIVNANQPGYGPSDIENTWRVPSDQDWNDFLLFLDPTANINSTPQSYIAGGLLKTTCTTPFTGNNGVWNFPNAGATNAFNFSAVPGGGRENGNFQIINSDAGWWTTDSQGSAAFWRSVRSYYSEFVRGGNSKRLGLSLRLVRPATIAEQALPDGTTSNQNALLPHYVGNSRTYITVKIDNQVWTAQNLIDTTYNNGVAIPEVTGNSAWNALTTGARCSYNNGSITPDQGQIELCGVPNP